MGSLIVLSALVIYAFALFRHPADQELPGALGAWLAVSFVGCLPALIRGKWRTQSHSTTEFQGGGMAEPAGRLFVGLRVALWGSFLLAVIHVVLLLSVPQALRPSSRQFWLFLSSFFLWFGCYVVFFSTYGVHSVALFRFFWNRFNRQAVQGRRRR